jgi:hypothetical protein
MVAFDAAENIAKANRLAGYQSEIFKEMRSRGRERAMLYANIPATKEPSSAALRDQRSFHPAIVRPHNLTLCLLYVLILFCQARSPWTAIRPKAAA